MPIDFHFLGGSAGGARGVVVEERGRLGEDGVRKRREVVRARHPVAMWRFVPEPHEERTFLVAAVAHPVDRQIRDDVADVALAANRAVRRTQVGVVVVALSGQHFPGIEPNGFALEVPLSKRRSLIAGRLQHPRKRGLRGVELIDVVEHPVGVAVFSGDDHRAGWSAYGVGHQRAIEANSFCRDPVDVRRLVQNRAVGPDGLIGVIVRDDQQNVGCRRGGRLVAGDACEEARQEERTRGSIHRRRRLRRLRRRRCAWRRSRWA